MDHAFKPLSLAVMALLMERPMHPYEIAHIMRRRHLEESIKLNFGSLYHAVDALEDGGLIAPLETERDGRRPERTVYALTEVGRGQFLRWLRDLIQQPTKEYSGLEAGLCFLSRLAPREAVELLKKRAHITAEELAARRKRVRSASSERGLSRLSLLEVEHALVVGEAELNWLRQLIQEIEGGKVEWQAHRRELVREAT